MEKRRLVVMVHGWGADGGNWWGSSKTSLPSDPKLASAQLYFHSYPTTKGRRGTLLQWVRDVWSGDGAIQPLGALGEDLWSRVRYEWSRGRYNSLLLFGHSFGGLVVADAVSHAAEQNAVEDQALLAALHGVAFCCSPLSGAELATRYRAMLNATLASNEHVEDLLASSQRRAATMDCFVNRIVQLKTPVTVFRASGDTIVKIEEHYEALKNIKFAREVIDGGHSDCIANIGPSHPERSKNYERIVAWLSQQSRILPQEMRQNFDRLIDSLANDIRAEPFAGWERLRQGSGVSDQYMLRIFVQKLIYVASRIHPAALDSANLWVAHIAQPSSLLQLRSEEREGYFETSQLIEYNRNFDKAHIRGNRVFEDAAQLDQNSVGGRAFVLRRPLLEAVPQSTGFPSRSEVNAGVTHILGIPLYRPADLNQLEVKSREGVPLVLTIDFHFDNEPNAEVEATLHADAERLQTVYREFAAIWIDKPPRLSAEPMPDA